MMEKTVPMNFLKNPLAHTDESLMYRTIHASDSGCTSHCEIFPRDLVVNSLSIILTIRDDSRFRLFISFCHFSPLF